MKATNVSSWMASSSKEVIKHGNRDSKTLKNLFTVESGKCSIRTYVLLYYLYGLSGVAVSLLRGGSRNVIRVGPGKRFLRKSDQRSPKLLRTGVNGYPKVP